MKITSWNVNSINARIEHLIKFIKTDQSDIYLIQELKCINEAFPLEKIENLKYFSYIGNTENVNKFLNIFLKSIPINTFEIRHKRIFKKDPKLINTIKNVLGDQINEYNYFDNKILDCIKNRFT